MAKRELFGFAEQLHNIRTNSTEEKDKIKNALLKFKVDNGNFPDIDQAAELLGWEKTLFRKKIRQVFCNISYDELLKVLTDNAES